MGSLKKTLTTIFLKQANMPQDEESVKKMIFSWWKNPRDKATGGLSLTTEGFDFLAGNLNLKNYTIPFPENFQWTTQTILFIDQYLDCPHYYTKKNIIVFNERRACELMLFSGDMRKYGIAKAMARQREINS